MTKIQFMYVPINQLQEHGKQIVEGKEHINKQSHKK
jgi:hypothetical protein